MPSPALARETEPRRTPTLVSVDGRTYPLQSAQIRARAEGGLASTTLVQAFANPYREPLEVIYTLPLPADGAVLGYTIRMGEKVIRGEVQPREAAEAAYREALYQGRTAGLLEEDRSDTFQQRLGNLPPGVGVTVEIDVLQPLAFLVGTGETGPVWEYRFPTVVGPRYQGVPGRVADAERLDLDRDVDGGIPVRVGLGLVVADGLPDGADVVSSSHAIVCQPDEGGVGVGVRLAESACLDRDLVLHWPATGGEVGVRVVEGGGVAGDAGRYALLTLTPPRAPQAAYRRDLTVLLDASGSMSGQPLTLAKRVVSELLSSLEPGDRFEVTEFASATRRLTWGLEKVTPRAVKRCLRAVAAVTAGGGTEMADAVEEAVASLRPDSQRQVVLVSDGYIGFENEILAKLGRRLPAGVRMHTVGIGAAPNRALTRAVARAGRGVELLAGDEASAATSAHRLCAATVRPVLTDLVIRGSAVRAVAPERPRDVFAGQPLVVAAELHAAGGSLEVQGNLSGLSEVWTWRTEVPAAGDGFVSWLPKSPLPIGALFGREAIADAEVEGAGAGEEDGEALAVRIEALGMRHRVVSRRTSLVAIGEEPSVDPRAPRRRERLPVELPSGVSAEGVGLLGGARGIVLGRQIAMGPARSPGGVFARGVQGRGVPKAGASPGRELFRAQHGPGGSLGDTGPRKEIAVARLVHREGQEVVLEFAVPFDHFQLPTGEVTVVLGARELGKAQVDPAKSTPPGPHAAELLIRLALRLGEDARWPEAGRFGIRWETIARDGTRATFTLVVSTR